ncbi:TlpA family protein disulfide reductase [Aegicerativicinus sediminis]|uniref:TlpA family protein disulfide reductase n=1 Tax=Aegicerativicinus sediminis TaxID=2893202 RepID=UPI001E4A2B48|nr:TlpA disulfide reductase family protein [Aegicerativicinus sediminis]
MKYFVSLALLVLFMSCKEEAKTPEYAVLNGQISNPVNDKVTISGGDLKEEITLNTDGSFTDTLSINSPGIYTLVHGREMTNIYLKNGQDLKFSLDTQNFDASLKYEGNGSKENNYLAEKMVLTDSIIYKNSQEFYSMDENAYASKLNEIENLHKGRLNAIEDLDEHFLQTESKNLVFDKYSYLQNYERNHRYFSKNNDFKVSENFIPAEVKNMEFNDADSYQNSQAYKQMAYSSVMNEIFETLGDNYQTASVEQLRTLDSVQIPALRNDAIGYIGAVVMSPGNPNMKEVHDYFQSLVTNEELKTKLENNYNKFKGLTKGNPSPQFVDYENHKGGTMSLADLKGKYVYIDVWATWCGPCKKEIPSLKEVEKKYHGKNIEFVSTSIDKASDHSKWVEMVKSENLGGTQLFADNDWNSKFVKEYAIEGIPRFILVDPQGNIVSADAPRPSNPKLVEMFDGLGI